jgi:hypothetical protein
VSDYDTTQEQNCCPNDVYDNLRSALHAFILELEFVRASSLPHGVSPPAMEE